MPIPSPKLIGFLRRLQNYRFISTFPPNPSPGNLSESFVLSELADLLSIPPKPPTPRLFVETLPENSPQIAPIHDLTLSPDEKLRGVFLQRFPGKFSVDSALSNTGVDLNAEIFALVLNKGSLGGPAMVSFFDWAIAQPGMRTCVETYNVMIKALGRRKFFSYMEDMLVRMKKDGAEANLDTLEIVMDCYVRARRVSKAVLMFENSGAIGIECNLKSLNVLIRCLCRRSHVGVANSLFNKMLGVMSFDNVTYNEIIGGWAKFGRVDKVESLWKMMVDGGLTPDNITYCHIIEVLGRSGRNDEAVDVFNKMEEKGCIHDTMTYNVMITNFSSVGDTDRCFDYYKRMCASNCVPDSDTYTKLVGTCLKSRRVADALELFDEMISRKILPSMGMVTSFIEPLCSFGPPYAAMMIYNKSKQVGCRLSFKAYKLLLQRLSRFGKSGSVLKLWEEMQENGYASDKEIYEYIVNGLCNIGQVDSAALVVEESLRRGFCPGKVVYSKLNSKLLQMNKVETAYKLFLKVKDSRLNANSRNFWRDNGWHF